VSDSHGSSSRISKIPYSFRTFILLIIIAVVAVGLSLLSYQNSIQTSEKIAEAAIQDLKENGRIQAYDMSKSLENRLVNVRNNLEILSHSPLIQLGHYSQARVLINAAERSTEGFTDTYFLIDETGKLQWAGAFVNQTVYDRYYGGERSDRPYFIEPRDTHQPYFSTLRDSVDGVPRLFSAYPIIANNDSGGGTFKGVVVAAMNLNSLASSVREQVPPGSNDDISLMDREGTILYTTNSELRGKNYFSDEVQRLLFTKYIPSEQKNQFNAIIQDSVAGNSGTGEYSFLGEPLIIAYNPVMFDQGNGNMQHAMTLYLTLPKAFASNIALLIEQQRNLSTIVPSAIGAVAVVIALMILRWNFKLERTVKERTNKLEAVNEQLQTQERAQREFINIAAHELRTPIQPILGLSEHIRDRIMNLAKQFQSLEKNEVVYDHLPDNSTTVNASTMTTNAISTTTDPGRTDLYNRTSSSSLSSSIEKIIAMLEVMNRNAKRLEKLTDNLLDVSRIENNKPLELVKEKFDLRQKIEDFVNDMHNTSIDDKDLHIRFNSRVGNAPVMIEGDRERIFQVISNLLSNAIKFTEKGEVVVVLDERDNQAIVSVIDTGSGIPSEIYPNLFTKFVTKSEKGTGLGLFISKNIVEAHGGKIWAEKNGDFRGAKFVFSLPILKSNSYDRKTNNRE
jgi:signal transduction histidine kinase